ncbi:MAG TPA: threonine synthase [Acidimicrobiia bacterium]|nr:threonine synthase [Acidimicrobiia bacterium]
MLYRSTRGGVSGREFAQVLIEGLAPDGGLYVPSELPTAPAPAIAFADTVAAVAAPFIRPDPLAEDLEEICHRVYGTFRHPEVAPVRRIGPDRHLLELFWGPTLSFKDYALQLVGALFDRVLARSGERLLILGATSGDTGSAAIEACRGREGIDIVVLYPDGAVSEVQRRQMTTITDTNVHTVAVAGSFDDCQRMVKEAFSEHRDRFPLGAINSINWARIMAQAAYYVHVAGAVPDHRFVVPTGNFGNVLAAHLARRMGALIGGLTVANNANHGLADLIRSGKLAVRRVEPTVAPAMDIQIPSNLERYLFEALDEDPARVMGLQERLATQGVISLDPATLARIRTDYEAGWQSDEKVVDTIRRVHESHGLIIDPHTAVAWGVADEIQEPTVVVATAHPAKFGDVVARALGENPDLPPELAPIMTRPERTTHITPHQHQLVDVLDSVIQTWT